MTTEITDDRRALLRKALSEIRSLRAEVDRRTEPVAILGAAVRMPSGIEDLDGYWSALRDGHDAITPLVDSEDGRRTGHAASTSRFAGLLAEVDGFDAEFFGISAAEAERMDPQQRLVLEVAWEAMEDAGLTPAELRAATTGVFLGVYGSDYLMMQFADPAGINAYTAPGGAHSIVANRLSYLLDLSGPSLAVDTACSSSLMAVHLAVRALRHGDCDIALVGGVNTILSPLSTTVTEKVLPLAPGGRCRTFDAGAEGIVRAEGCGMVVLTRESVAAAEGRPVRAFIRGTAANHDGRTNGLTAPSPRAQTELLRRALRDAAADPAEVVYIEAHGTGTPLGDPIEFDALRAVYGAGDEPCPVGAVKTNFGHQEAAAGIAGLVKAMLVLEHDEVPPNLHLERPNPELDLTGTRLRLPRERTPLGGETGRKLAAISSFGFGGANVHAVLAAAPREEVDPHAEGALVLPISARSAASARALAGRYADLLAAADHATAAEICAAAATRRAHLPVRLCLTGDTVDALVDRARTAKAARNIGAPRHRTLFVFSGQGSQWPEMGRLLADEPAARAELDTCDALVRRLAGWSLWEELLAAESDSRLHRTDVAQVCIAAVELALAALWQSWGVRPAAVVGHSMGELVAATVAGMLSREQAFELLVRRAALTERHARGGAMCSIALPAAAVTELLAGQSEVTIGAVNGPRSTVITGPADGVRRIAAEASTRGASVKDLPVEYGFHSTLLAACAPEFAAHADAVRAAPGSIPMYSTVTGKRVTADHLTGAHWAANLADAVLFAPALQAALADDQALTTVLEVGPHPVLIRDIAAAAGELDRSVILAASLRRGQSRSASLDHSVAELYLGGHELDWSAVLGTPSGRPPLPHYPWNRSRHWLPERWVVEEQHVHATVRPAAAKRRASGPVALVRAHHVDRPTRLDALTGFVRERIARALRKPITEIDEATPIRDYGLESLVVVEMKNEIEAESGTVVPLAQLLETLEQGSARDLAKVIVEAESAAAVTGDEVGSGSL
ncbi:type I polyketide synthase [Nocardia amikacinitolerans]|uniref:type I polyketide synthase n=1 Tax=Nocardia amikacinitolerans TaxID=756689 RepID=UPI0020A244F2|nr:type I polyketide synthase [Nocardia amikacinitolerans]MCP2277780.1 Acyl transferase domain-containing protein [Nocardia amikacinitolerans]